MREVLKMEHKAHGYFNLCVINNCSFEIKSQIHFLLGKLLIGVVSDFQVKEEGESRPGQQLVR